MSVLNVTHLLKISFFPVEKSILSSEETKTEGNKFRNNVITQYVNTFNKYIWTNEFEEESARKTNSSYDYFRGEIDLIPGRLSIRLKLVIITWIAVISSEMYVEERIENSQVWKLSWNREQESTIADLFVNSTQPIIFIIECRRI